MAKGKSSVDKYYDNLVEQDRVDTLFKPLEKENEKHLQEIEQLKFILKNCYYNKNRLIEEINRSNAGFGFSDKETLKRIANSIGLKSETELEMGIPITFWADILMFEFHAFVSNVIRCCNFLTIFKLKNVDEIQI